MRRAIYGSSAGMARLDRNEGIFQRPVEVHASQGTWASGRGWAAAAAVGNGGQAGVYGTLGTPASTNTPGARSCCRELERCVGQSLAFRRIWLRLPEQWISQRPVEVRRHHRAHMASGRGWAAAIQSRNQPGVYGTLGMAASTNIPESTNVGRELERLRRAISGSSAGTATTRPERMGWNISTTCGSSTLHWAHMASGFGWAAAMLQTNPESTGR